MELCMQKALYVDVKEHSALFSLIKDCGRLKDLHKGSRIHNDVLVRGLLKKDIILGNALISMYVKCDALTKAQELFNELPVRDVVTWNTLIAGYAQHGLGGEALSCFREMQDEGLYPDAVTFICILKACGSIRAAEKGKEIHVEVSKQGLLEKDIVLGTALVDMYAKCGGLARAQEIFNKLPARNVVTWNALIAGYVQHGLSDEALACFRQMQDEGLSPNASTFTSILKLCGSIGAEEKGEEIHAEISRQGLLEKKMQLGTALVDMYAKCGALAKAQGVFDNLHVHDVVTWNALITGYAQHDCGDEALHCYEWMQDEGCTPDAITFASILRACGSIGAAEKGREIHAEVRKQGLLEKDVVLSNALLDMYAKCGVLARAQEVFDELPAKDLITWNALIAGYGQIGKVKTVFDSFIKMTGEGMEPDMVTFVVLLTACSHAGLVEEGQMYFDSMSTAYQIIPTAEHHTSMVDILSRVGQFDEALYMMEKVPPSDGLLLWSPIISACQRWANLELGRWAFKYAIQLNESYASAAYVCMSNICISAAGMQERADNEE